MTDPVMPFHARRMVDMARNAGMTVIIESTDTILSVDVSDPETGDSWSMAWFKNGNGWRYGYGSDGWSERMTLREIASYLGA